jgi:TatD DNase family protein
MRIACFQFGTIITYIITERNFIQTVLTDTHCHLDFNKFDSDRLDVIRRALAAGVARILIPGTSLPASQCAIKVAETHPNLFAAVGIHPTEALTWDNATPAALSELAANLKVMAIGEIGLDYYWDSAPHPYQQKVLKEQLSLAADLNLPVILHMREKADAEHGDCAEDLIKILKEWVTGLQAEKNPLVDYPGVLHSFSGSAETANQAINLNFFIGITGPITYKKAEQRRQIIAGLPLEKILIETDAPFLAPEPYRGHRNEPAYVQFIADKIGELHQRNLEEVAAITSQNAARLFSWGE